MKTALTEIKETENREALLFLLDDLDAKKVLVAWTLYRPVFRDRARVKKESIVEAYWALWEESDEVDIARLSNVAGVPYQTTLVCFERFKHARLIYPDGTISESALQIVRAEVGSYIKNLLPKHRVPSSGGGKDGTNKGGSGKT